MSSHPRRLALVCAVAGALASGALAGPAMAAGDEDSSAPECRKAGGDQMEYVLHVRKAGGDPNPLAASIIGVL